MVIPEIRLSYYNFAQVRRVTASAMARSGSCSYNIIYPNRKQWSPLLRPPAARQTPPFSSPDKPIAELVALFSRPIPKSIRSARPAGITSSCGCVCAIIILLSSSSSHLIVSNHHRHLHRHHPLSCEYRPTDCRRQLDN